jgi:hypothetical protein
MSRMSLIAIVIAPVLAIATVTNFASADTGGNPNANACKGQFISDIASTWPYPETHTEFPPPPGSLALWIDIFSEGDRQAFEALVNEACQ